MTDLTAREVLALSALMGKRPMSSVQLSQTVSDMGMHTLPQDAATAVRSLISNGMAEPTAAANLGMYRITAEGRAWIVASTAPEEGEICQYNGTHRLARTPALTMIDCGPAVGIVPACQECAGL